MKHRIADYIESLIPYVPGKPIQETRREFHLSKVIKLASNENPLGPSPKALQAIQAAHVDLHRYPDSSAYQLKQALSKYLEVPYSFLTLGNGSNDVIDSLIRTFCIPGDSIVAPRASFIAYQIAAQVHGVKTLEVKVDSEFRFKTEDLLAQVADHEKVKVVFLANPNNPTGNYISSSQMDEIIQGLSAIREGSVVLALDYAYWEYVTAQDLPDPLSLLAKYPSAIVLKTFSKVYGLAGLRVGYGIAASEIISYLEKVRQPFNLNSLALAGAEAALADTQFVEQARKLNQDGMRFWESALRRLHIPFFPSQGNFLLVNIKKGMGLTGSDVFQACLEKGVVFRPLANYGLGDYLRITIGTSEENAFGVGVLETLKLKAAL